MSGEPYTSSAAEQFKSSFGAVRMPSKTHGSSSSQLWLVSRVCKVEFRCRWKRSTRPFVCGWYAVVYCCLVPRGLAMVVHKLDMNCEPLLEVMSNGVPKRAIQWKINASAHVSVSVTFSGIASGHLVN